MPLLKRKPFTLKEPPKDLKPNEHVYQVRFTKEMFQDYDEYLNRVNLYRPRIWMCKSTGKSNLTHEEALVSEKQASEKFQDLPSELTAPALEVIQFGMLSLQDLSSMVAAKLHECFFVGAEVSGRKGERVHPRRILKMLGDGAKEMQYEDLIGESRNSKRKKENAAKREEEEPIDDLLVHPGVDDPVLIDRPSPTNDFGVPMDSVGDLLMVWDFCSSFDRFLKLSPFSFEDFENAICHKDKTGTIIGTGGFRSMKELLLKVAMGYYSRKEKVDALMGSLNIKGEREMALKTVYISPTAPACESPIITAFPPSFTLCVHCKTFAAFPTLPQQRLHPYPQLFPIKNKHVATLGTFN